MNHSKPHNRFLWILLILFGPFCLWGQTQWIENGILAAQSTVSIVNLKSVSDGNGGTFIVYEHNPSGDMDIYAQWIDGFGNIKWPGGIIVSSAAGDQKNPAVACDTSGGIFITWQDEVSDNIYVQRLNGSGVPLWISGGIVVCSAAGEQSSVQISKDGQGGAVLVWKDKRAGSESDLYAQRLNEDGAGLWTANGVPVTTASGNQSSHLIIGDDNGGVFVIWEDYRNGYSNIDIYVQKLSSAGSQTWTANGVAVVSEIANQYSPDADTSANQLIISWTDNRNANGDIFSQALDFNGNLQWTSGGVSVCTMTGTQDNSKLARDGSGGAIITWGDNRTGYDIYAQRINALGAAQWTTNGVAVNTSSGYQYFPEIISHSSGAWIIWNDNRSGSDIELYGQHIRTDGTLLFDADGLPVVTAINHQENLFLVPDGSGGVIAVWQDGRNSQSDIYAQLVNDNISFTIPVLDTIWAGTQSHTIRWNMKTDSVLYHHLRICASSVFGDGFPHTITEVVPPDQLSQTWTPTVISSDAVIIKIQAQDYQDSIYCEFTSDVFTIDSDPPESFLLLSPAEGASVELKPTFVWESTTDALTGLDHYEIWIDNILVKDNLQTTTCTLSEAEALIPGNHTWTIRAVDQAGLYYAPSQRSLNASEDTTPPEPFHLCAPNQNSWTTQTNPSFTWNATTDSKSGLKKYQLFVYGTLKIDNIPLTDTTTNALTLTEGDHSWYIVAVDSLGNTRQSEETWTVRIDNQPPKSFNLLQPQHLQWLSEDTPAFTWESTSDTSIGIGLKKYQLWVDDGLLRDNISGNDTNYTLTPGEALTEGIHTWYISALDSLSNYRTSGTTFTLKIDQTDPLSFSLTTPADQSAINNLSPDFTWQSTSDALSGLKSYELWIDGSLNKDSISVTSCLPAAPLTEGSHTWAVHAVDSAGNSTTTSTFTVVADTTSPAAFDLVQPLQDDTVHIKQPTLIWRTTTDAISGFEKFQLFMDGQSIQENLTAQDTSYTLPNPLENGNYTWKVWAWDKAGNIRISEYPQFVVDCNPPQITSSGTAAAVEDVPFAYTATAEDPDNDPVNITFEDYPVWLSPSGTVISGSPVQGASDTSFLVIATDGLLYDSLKVVVQVQSVNDTPTISVITDQTTQEDHTSPVISFTISDEETPAGNLILSAASSNTPLIPVDNILFGGSGANRTIQATPAPNQNGTSEITITVNDGEKTASESFQLTVQAVNDPPVISNINDQIIQEDQTITSLLFTVSDMETQAAGLNVTATSSNSVLVPNSNLVLGGSGENRNITITPAADQTGVTEIIVTVFDGETDSSVTFSVTVTGINDKPFISALSDQTINEDESTSAIPFEISDVETAASSLILTGSSGDTILIPNDRIVFGGSGTSRTVILSPAADQSGSALISITVSDGVLDSTVTFSITVTPVNDAPRVTSPDTATATEGILFSYRATACDIDNNMLNIYYLEFPSWLQPAGPEIYGTPPNGCQDTTFKVVASDNQLSHTIVVNVTVIPVNDPPYFCHPFPRPVIDNIDTLTIDLDYHISDPDDPDSNLVWSYAMLDTHQVNIQINQETHIVAIEGVFTQGDFKIAFTATDPMGAFATDTLTMTIIATGILDPVSGAVPKTYSLENNFPNPFNPVTTIRYGLPGVSHVSLRIYNAIGQEVDLLVDEKQPPGIHEIQWRGTGFPSGIYFYRLQADRWQQVKRMVLIK